MLLRSWSSVVAACVFFVSCALPVQAATSCVPKGDTGKILKSKDANDVDSYVGSAWSLLQVRREGRFLSGVLATPRLSVSRTRVFVIADEWNCD